MKLSDIHPGHSYTLRIPVALPFGGRVNVTTAATVVDKVTGGVIVETTEPVCTNLADFPPPQQAWAMVQGRLRYERRPVRRQVRAADLIATDLRGVEVGA